MKTDREFKRIEDIEITGSFVYRGVTYTLDVEATNNDKINANLGGKPLKKLTGNDGKGNTVIVWSHDCEVITEVPTFSEPTTTIKKTERVKRPRTKKKLK